MSEQPHNPLSPIEGHVPAEPLPIDCRVADLERQVAALDTAQSILTETVMLNTSSMEKMASAQSAQWRNAVTEARNHLHIALLQVSPTDDQIIVDHMKSAKTALGGSDGQ